GTPLRRPGFSRETPRRKAHVLVAARISSIIGQAWTSISANGSTWLHVGSTCLRESSGSARLTSSHGWRRLWRPRRPAPQRTRLGECLWFIAEVFTPLRGRRPGYSPRIYTGFDGKLL